MVEIKSAAEVAAMREAGRVVAQALVAVREQARPGVRLSDLDAVAAAVISGAGAKPVFLDYHPSWAPTPFPGVICASVNDDVVHAIPGRRRLEDGDLVSIDCGADLGGWCGDAAVSFVVGTPDPADLALIEVTEQALAAGIAAARPGGRIGDIGAAVGAVARSAGYGMLADHGGHGIGRVMHEEPYVPNEGRRGKGRRLEPGLVIAIEPMLHAGGSDGYVTRRDGWTLATADGSRAAHAEHTVAVTADGPRVLTVL